MARFFFCAADSYCTAVIKELDPAGLSLTGTAIGFDSTEASFTTPDGRHLTVSISFDLVD